MEGQSHKWEGVLYLRIMAASGLAVFVLLGLPYLVSGAVRDVVINEIMWDGTGKEYVELYNTLDEDVLIGDWSLTRQQAGGQVKTIVTFDEEMVMAAGAYFLIEKKEEASEVVADLITSKLTLVNGGELVQLLDDNGVVIDQANQLDDWMAGEDTSVGVSMERSDTTADGTLVTSWHTSTGEVGGRFGTPGSANSVAAVNQPPEAVIGGPENTTVIAMATFTAEDSMDPEDEKLSYDWEFGDGDGASGVEVTHQFNKSGTYVVRLTVSDGLLEDEVLHEVTVTKPNYSDDVVQKTSIKQNLSCRSWTTMVLLLLSGYC